MLATKLKMMALAGDKINALAYTDYVSITDLKNKDWYEVRFYMTPEFMTYKIFNWAGDIVKTSTEVLYFDMEDVLEYFNVVYRHYSK